MPTALVIQHEDYEALAGFQKPLEARGYEIAFINVRDPHFDTLSFLDPDLLVIMGGPMGVYETGAHPWMNHEIVRVAERMLADLPTVGVCLGSQVIAAAMGANVYKGPHNEVGFKPVFLTETGKSSPLAELGDAPLLHWHGDTFELPKGATLLASTDLYPNQAFSRGPNILALQFHPEMGEDASFHTWCDKADPFIAAAGTNVDRLNEEHARLGPAAVAAGRIMLDRWLSQLDS
jgi:GMP synthase (glutamine-hydrolysing)